MAITLDETGLLLALGLDRGDTLREGFILDRALPHHEGGVLLSWRDRGGRSTVGLQVRLRDDTLPAWRRTRSLDVITHLPSGAPNQAFLDAFTPLVALLEDRDEGPGSVISPEPSLAAPEPARIDLPVHRRTTAPSPFEFGRVFVLDLESDCHQSCSFCSTRAKWSPVHDFGDEAWTQIESGLRGARADGYDVLRVSGIDPLTHPYLLRAIETAGALGYGKIHLYSPSTRYAEAGFLEDLLTACGSMEAKFHVPLYGPSSEIHDAVTGRPGSYDKVLAGVEALTQSGQGERIVWLSVLTGSNAPHWSATKEQMGKWPAPIQVLLPFPSTRASDDAFYTAATTHEEAIYALAGGEGGDGEIEGLSEILPCVRYRFERRHGTPTLTEGPFHPVTALIGTLFEHADYRRLNDEPVGDCFSIPTRACPHHEACALAPLCPRGVYEAYASRFGLEELRPVSQSDLDTLGFRL
jgi:hypothetical protein